MSPSPTARVEELRRFVGFSAAEEALVARARPIVLAGTAHVVGQFYDRLLAHPEAASILQGPEQVERLQQSLGRWLTEVFTGPWDESYRERRAQVGQAHVRIRLPQRYVIGAMQHVQRAIHDLVYDGEPDVAVQRQMLSAIHRLLAVDLALMVESYQLEREEESIRAFAEIVRNTSDVVLTLRGDGQVLYVNRDCPAVARESMFNEGLAAITGVQTPESRERLQQAWRAALADGLPRINVPVEHVDGTSGEHFHCLFSLLPEPGADSDVVLVHAVIRDVTELRALEADVEEQRRLAAVGEMVAGVAHEVRNPLQNVLLGLRRIDTEQVDRRQEAIAQVRAGAEQIDRLITDLLSFSKRLALSTTTLDATDLLQSAVDACAAEHPDRVMPTVAAPAAGPGKVAADPFRMPQALRNLVQNALEAAPGEGAVELSIVLPDPAHVEFVVSDRGPGLPPEVRERLFEPFVTTKPHGTGLGLAIARRLVEAHGGRLTFEDRPGGGTTARVRLSRVVS